MKKQLTLSLFVLLFLFSSSVSFASFPVKKTITQPSVNTTTNVEKQDVVATYEVVNGSKSGKSQLVALILAIAIGTLGIHRFYLGYIWQGILQLVMTVFSPLTFFLSWLATFIWVIFDIVNIATGKLQPKKGNYSSTL